MNAQEMKRRTKELALANIRLISEFPRTIAGKIIANQLVRSVTSVGANYRAVLKSQIKSRFHF